LKVVSDDDDVTFDGRLFQTRDAAAAKERSDASVVIYQEVFDNHTALQALLQAFVRRRLDYCNALLAGVADVHLKGLQSVQNAAARLVSGSRRCDPITPILARLHWLPVRQRIAFKTAVLVWKALHGAALLYLSDFCVPVDTVSGRQHLRSATAGVPMVPRARTTTGQRSFAVNGPTVWNSLPAALRAPDRSLAGFKDHLKTYLFEH